MTDASSSRRAPAACTIIARNYLSYARILAASYLEHEPTGRFYLFVVDGIPADISLDQRITVLDPTELDLPDFYAMCFKYSVTELCTAVKPRFLMLLMEHYDEERVIFFDPDIWILRPLPELLAAMDSANIVLIPHLLHPIPLDGRRPSEQSILIAGAYNLGFIALTRSDETRRFLAWWHERLLDYCVVRPSEGLFVDQRWVDLVPSLFPSVAILRDDTYDVAYWNLHYITIERSGEQFLANGRPLTFFHFSGFDPERPHALSKHQDRTPIDRSSALDELLAAYAALQMQSGYRTCIKWRYGYTAFDNGVAVSPILRELYLKLDADRRATFGNPFRTDGDDRFFAWATRPDPALADLSPFLMHIYRVRRDVAAAYPDLRNGHRHAFIDWALTSGPREMQYDPRLVQLDKTLPPASNSKAADPASTNGTGVASRTPGSSPGARTPDLSGVNVSGYFRHHTGIAAIARGYVGALRAIGVPFALCDVSHLSVLPSVDTTISTFDAKFPYEVNLVCVNADSHFEVAAGLGDEFFRNRYNIAVWFWELPHFPEEWHNRFQCYDEIWAASSFIANSLSMASPIPVVYVPPVIGPVTAGSRQRGRNHLGFGPETFVFLNVFDAASFVERKNPAAVVAAFKSAFAPTDRVHLIIKCINNDDSDPGALDALRDEAAGYPISFKSGYLDAQAMADLYESCDAYVSLHRSEGLGLTIAEAMARGKPVIATDWSGNTDLMDISNSYPVEYELTHLEHDVGPYRAGQVWAEPCVDHAAALMAHVVANPSEAAARGQAAQRFIESAFSEERVAEVLRQRLKVVARRQSGANVPHGAPAPWQQTLLPPALPEPGLGTSRLGRVGLLYRRIMSLLMRFQINYQRSINLSILGFIREAEASHTSQDQRLMRLETAVQALESYVREMEARSPRSEPHHLARAREGLD